MPLPTPKENESQDDFISRCVGEIAGEFKDNAQRAAVCHAQWDKAKEGASAASAASALTVPAEVLRALGETARAVRSTASMRMSLNADDAIEINGRRLRGDPTKAYIDCVLSHSFPVVTIGNTAIHPNTVAASYQSMLHQVFDLNHFIKQYAPDRISRDRILGAIVEVEFPSTPPGGWVIPASKEDAPGIRAVATVCKMAEGMEDIIRQHVSGQRTWAVSMENWYLPDQSGFLVKAEPADYSDWAAATPQDIAAHGYVYVPWGEAPSTMLACLDKENSEITQDWEGHELILLIGGLGSTIHYHGIGITPKGREVEATILGMAASGATTVSAVESTITLSMELARNVMRDA